MIMASHRTLPILALLLVQSAILLQPGASRVVDPRNPFAIFYEGYDPENYGLTWEEVGGSFVGSNFSAVALPCLDVFEAIDTMIIHNFTFQIFGGLLNATARAFPDSLAASLLSEKGNLSVLAPIDEAFANVSVSQLLADKELLRETVDSYIIEDLTPLGEMADIIVNVSQAVGQLVDLALIETPLDALAGSGVGLIGNTSDSDYDYGLENIPLTPDPYVVWSVLCGGGVLLPAAGLLTSSLQALST